MNLKIGRIKGFHKTSGFIDGLEFKTTQVSGGIENGTDAYYDLNENGTVKAVYGKEATIPGLVPKPHLDIFEVIEELTKNVPNEEWDKLPTDLAENHDKYLYDNLTDSDKLEDSGLINNIDKKATKTTNKRKKGRNN